MGGFLFINKYRMEKTIQHCMLAFKEIIIRITGVIFMKKISSFWLSLILSATLLTGCGGVDFGGGPGQKSNDDDSSDISSSSSSSGSDSGTTGLDYTKQEAQNKLKTLGRTSGFEIGLEFTGENETGTVETDSATLGYKVDVLWVVGECALKQTPTATEIYSATAGAANQYDYEATADASVFGTYVDSFTEMFYIAYEYNTYLKASGPTTYLGRSAKKYTFTGALEQVYANIEVIVDNETGITLKLAAQGQDLDGSSTSGSLVVTSFKTGDQVRTPTLNKDSGGEGGGGEGGGQGGETEKLPKAGKYSYDGTRSRNPGMFAGGYFEIDEQGNGTYCDYPDYLGEKHYYTGTFALSGNDIVMTTVFGILESNGRITNTTSMDGAIFTFTYLGEDSYGITLDNSYLVYKYGEGSQPVDLSRYMATAAQYAHYITDMADIGKNGNLKFNVMYKVGNVAYQSTTLENNYGNYYEGLVYLDNNQTVRMLYVQVQGRDGYYDMYHWENNAWAKGSSSYPMDLSLFADKVALLDLSYVPFDKFSEPTDASDPCYTCAKFDYENEETGVSIHLTNIKLYFVDGVLDKYSYKTANNEQFDVQITDRGHVDFDIPGEQQQPQEVQDNALLSGQSGAHFVFARADLGNYTGHDLDTTIDALEDTSFNFFTNGNVEMIYNANGLLTVTLGTYTLMKKEGINQATARLAMTERYVNGVKNSEYEYSPTTLVQYYFIQQDELHIIQTGTNGLGEALEIHIIYTRSTDIPTPYDPSAVTPPEESKWPADNIAKKLQELEINVKLPAAKTPNDGINEVTLSVESNSLVITVKFNAYGSYTDSQAAAIEFAQYANSLTDFDINYGESDITNGIYAYVAKDGKSIVKLHYIEGQTTLKIVASKYNANAYPADKVRDYLAKNSIDVTIPSLEMDGVSYQFIEDNGLLMITPTAADVTTADILSNCYAAFANAGFKRVFMTDNEEIAGQLFFDAELKCVISSTVYSGMVVMVIEAYDQESMGNFLQYPKTALDESYPEGIRDYYPSFEVEGATYYVDDISNGVELYISLQEGQNMTAILRELKTSLTADAGYVLTDGKYVSENGQIEITINDVDNLLIIISIEYLPPEEETVTYTFTNTSEFDIFDSDPQFYAYVWDNKGEGHWEELHYDEETGKFTLEVSSYIIGCKIVRFATNSEIDWARDAEGNVNEGVEIWNETGDIALSGQSSALNFKF